MSDDGEWVEKVQKETGKKYYFNKKLGQTAWEKPTGSVEEQNAWTERHDPVTGTTYYFNTITKIRSAENPLKKTSAPATVPPLPKSPPMSIQNQVSESFGNDYDADLRNLGINPYAMPDTGDRRHVSVKLTDLGGLVAQHAPTDDQLNRITAMKRVKKEPEEGPRINLELLAQRNKDEKPKPMMSQTYEEFAKKYFDTKKKGMFGKPRELVELTVYSEKPMKRSLLGLGSSGVEKKSYALSKLLLKFMDQPNTDAAQTFATIKQMMIICTSEAPQDLRDEFFCQIMKQIRNNPADGSTFKGWQMLTLCCGSFPPSKKLEDAMRNFLSSESNNVRQGLGKLTLDYGNDEDYITIGEVADYALLRLDKCIEFGPRNQVPSMEEVKCVFAKKPVTVSVFLINGLEITLQVETWTTVKDLIDDIGEYLSVRDTSLFAVVEVSEDNKEYVLPVEDRVLDVLADWEMEASRRKQPMPQNQLLFRLRLFLPIDDDDTRAIELAYYQAVYDVTEGRYPVTKEDLVQLIALHVQEKYGDCSAQEQDPLEDKQDFLDMLPENYHKTSTSLKVEIHEAYRNLEGMEMLDAMKSYLEVVDEWPTYGCQVFPVTPLNNSEYPELSILAINGKAVYVIDPETKDFVQRIAWDDIVTWGYSDVNAPGLTKKGKQRVENTFCLIMGNFMQQLKIYFRTPQAIDAYRLLEAYGNKIKGYKQ